MANGFFVTGTDTGVGKTRVTVALMRELQAMGLRVAGMKPVATGGVWRAGRLVNADALAIQAAASWPLPYERVNPCVYEAPVSPHIAAHQAGESIEFDHILACYEALVRDADCVVVEGVGGWRVPLAPGRDVADLARYLAIPVFMVVGLKLGCINHARLTRDAIPVSTFGGWVANYVQGDWPGLAETVDALTREIGCEPVGKLPFSSGETRVREDFPARWERNEILRLMAA